MKYMLDIVLIVGLLWMGWMWNGEKQNGLKMSDEIDRLKANLARVELELGSAKDAGSKTEAELARVQGELEQASRDLQEKTAALEDKTAQADKLVADLKKAVAKIKELRGIKDRAIVAEMPSAVKKAE